MAGLKLNVRIGQRRCHDDKQTEDVQQIRFSAWIAGCEGGYDECENALQRALAASNNVRRERRGAANVQNIRNTDHKAHYCREKEESQFEIRLAQLFHLGQQNAPFRIENERQEQNEAPNTVVI